MGTTNVTFDVDADLLATYLPQVGMEGTGDVLTTARVNDHIAGAASEVNASLLSIGFVPGDIAADTDSVAYIQAQRAVCFLALPDVLRAVGVTPQGEGALEALRERGLAMLKRWERRPLSLGWDSDDSFVPRARTTTQILDLDAADTTTDQARRLWDSDDDHDVSW